MKPEKIFTCPYCYKERHFYYNLKKRVFNCFRCGTSGTYKRLVKDFGKDFLNEIEAGLYFVQHDDKKTDVSLPEEYRPLDKDRTGIFKTYVLKRGVPLSIASDYNIGFCMDGQYAGYIIIPVYMSGKLVYWQGRSVFNIGKKYVNPSVSRSDVIFNFDAVEKYDEIIICEGIFDAIRIGYNAIAIFGKVMTRDQINRLRLNFSGRIYIMLDGDAKKESIELAKTLFHYGYEQIYVTKLPENRDPASYKKSELQYIKINTESFI